jgi:hypothetical protein
LVLSPPIEESLAIGWSLVRTLSFPTSFVVFSIASVASIGLGTTDADEPAQLINYVFLTDDTPMPLPGCDAISIIDIRTGEAVMRGPIQISPGRMAATTDFSTVLATVASAPPWPLDPLKGPFLYRIVSEDPDLASWRVDTPIIGDNFASYGDVAILPDNDRFLVSTVGTVPRRDGPPYPTPWPRPYRVQKYRLSDISPREGGWQVGPSNGSTIVQGVAANIVLDSSGKRAQLLLDNDTLVTLDVERMSLEDDPIRLPPLSLQDGYKPEHLGSMMHAVMTSDSRYLLTNRWWPPEISVVDLERRSVVSVEPAGKMPVIGGLSLNRAWNNAGLLAVHGGDRIVVLEFVPPASFDFVASADLPEDVIRPIPPPFIRSPVADIEWSADGSQLIVSGARQFDLGTEDFIIYDVNAPARRISYSRSIVACPDLTFTNGPNGILTANGFITPTATNSSTPMPSLTATPTISPSPTPTFSPPSVTPTVTEAGATIYLPISWNMVCMKRRSGVDVGLVIDASTTMERLTVTGRSKLKAAQEAALELAAAINLDPLSVSSDRIAIIGFNDTAWVESPLTNNLTETERAIERLSDRTAEGTRLDLAVREGITALIDPSRPVSRPAILIVLTDGLPNRVPTPEAGGSQEDTVLAEADVAKGRGWRVYTVGLGAADAPDPLERINSDLLLRMASSPSAYFETPDAEDLSEIFSEISESVVCR